MILTDRAGVPYEVNFIGGFTVTPNDGADLAKVTEGLFIGAAGNVAVVMQDGSSVTFTGLAAGVVHRLSVKRVLATGTTATGIVGLV